MWFKRIQKTNLTWYAVFFLINLFYKWAFVCINWPQTMSKILLIVWTYSFILRQLAIDIVRLGLLADHNVTPGYHIGDALPNKKRYEWLKIFKKYMYDSWYSYKDHIWFLGNHIRIVLRNQVWTVWNHIWSLYEIKEISTRVAFSFYYRLFLQPNRAFIFVAIVCFLVYV